MNPIAIAREVVKGEAARLIAYSTLAALTAANIIGHALGYNTLPDGVANGLTIFVGAIVTEAIRQFVYSENTVNAMSVTSEPVAGTEKVN